MSSRPPRRLTSAKINHAHFSFDAMTPVKRGLSVFALGALPVFVVSRIGSGHLAQYGVSITETQFGQLFTTILSFGGGLLSGIIPVGLLYLLRRFPDIGFALLGLTGLYLVLVPGVGTGMAVLGGGAGFWIGLVGGWVWLFGISKFFNLTTFGSTNGPIPMRSMMQIALPRPDIGLVSINQPRNYSPNLRRLPKRSTMPGTGI